MKITGSAPILLVTDVTKSAEYFVDKVGFQEPKYYGEPTNFCILHRDGFHLMLAKANNAKDIQPNWTKVDSVWDHYFWVDDAKAWYEELIRRGAKIDYKLHEKPYGCLEFGIQDLDGHDIAFGQILEA